MNNDIITTNQLIGLIVVLIFIFLNTNLQNYVNFLPAIILSISVLIGICTYHSQMIDRTKMKDIEYSNISAKILELDKIFMNNPLLNRLYYDIYKHDTNLNRLEIELTHEINKSEHIMANIIFQTISDISNYKHLTFNEPSNEFVNTFKNWFKSKILKDYWSKLKYEYNENVIQIIDKLIIL
jgi:hypothetical protein